MLRFVKNTKKKREFREIGDLTVHEIEHAEKTLIKIVQAKFFPTEDSFPNMNVITDEEGIKRVKTRITEWSDNPEFIYPIILPDECLFTQLLIEYYSPTKLSCWRTNSRNIKGEILDSKRQKCG
ncbi:integrase catalytic domain-containing protein [Trichonephila inaurata madagascariensis]|uniref:Integrase catalytic domain-containing protein n=1 Tax=Trichonephila inaurata madagascariensis TaxID=2747483 RepID=A0A8X6IJR8_9ARAC|nr:integrase catalytic domain-containing protein [Trichonephila inaurata madagascariensis]